MEWNVFSLTTLHKQLRYGYLASYIRKIREMKRREKTKYRVRKKEKKEKGQKKRKERKERKGKKVMRNHVKEMEKE